MGMRDGESGTTRSFSDDFDAVDSSESLFGVPMIGDKGVGRDTLCLRGVGVLRRTSSSETTTLPLREDLSLERERYANLSWSGTETLCLLGILVPTFSLSTCITPFDVRIGGIFFRFDTVPTLCKSRNDEDSPTSFLTMFDNVS